MLNEALLEFFNANFFKNHFQISDDIKFWRKKISNFSLGE